MLEPIRTGIYATERARDGALSRGFDFSLGDWRDLFLAITDTLAQDGTHSLAGHVSAAYVGLAHSGERWRIDWRGRALDVLYEPHRAMVVSVTDSRPGAGGAVAPLPVRPLFGGAKATVSAG